MTWANVGCCALVFASVLDLRFAILYLIGLAGAAFAFDRSHRSHALGAVFGVGMLFYGIELPAKAWILKRSRGLVAATSRHLPLLGFGAERSKP